MKKLNSAPQDRIFRLLVEYKDLPDEVHADLDLVEANQLAEYYIDMEPVEKVSIVRERL